MHQEIISKFNVFYGLEPQLIVSAPGRINLIGEHTDYNLGFVLPAAIDKYIYFAFCVNPSSTKFEIYADDINDSYTGDLDSVTKNKRTWVNYLLGIIDQIQKKQHSLQGFKCYIKGNIPIGSGLSSSAALECGFAYGLNELFQLGFNKMEIAKIGQASENQFLGINSGILDQFSSVFGKKDHAIKLDCKSMDYAYSTLNFSDHDFVLINTNVKHEHLTSGYNDRTNECKKAAQILNEKYGNISTLRDGKIEMLTRDLLPDPLFRRARFIIGENERLHSFSSAMEEGNIDLMGKLLYQTHDGLQHDYEVSCRESDCLVDLASQEDGIKGARMMGGGFGGCVLILMESKNKTEVANRILYEYSQKMDCRGDVYYISIVDGVRTIGG